MAKIRITENELKQLIRESVENVVNEDYGVPNYFEAYKQQAQAQQAGNERIAPGPTITRSQADARNATVNAALSNWNKLGTIGQIKEIQKLVGATPDGKIGPQTLGKIYVALQKGSGLEYADFRPGKAGTYTNI